LKYFADLPLAVSH
jgi:hypothetical protein